MQNEPNFGPGRSLGTWAVEVDRAKQSQLPLWKVSGEDAQPTKSRGESCKTNPISAVTTIESAHYSSIPSFQHSNPRTWDGGQMCKTNPIPRFRISDCGLRIGGRLPAGRPVWPSAQGRLCETKPNLGGPGYLRDGTWGSLLRKTNPILPVSRRPEANRAKRTQFLPGPTYPPFQYSTIPAFQPDADCAKRSQFREVPGGTGPARRWMQGKCAKRSQFRRRRVWDGAAGAWVAGRTCKTKPICTAPAAQTAHPSRIPTGGEDKRAKQSQFSGVKCAKRTQFLDCGLRIADCGLGTDFRRGDEPCKTNPISEGVSSVKCQVLSGRSRRPGLQGFLLQTLHFRLGQRRPMFWHVARGGLDSWPQKRGGWRAGMPGSWEPPDMPATCAAPATAFCRVPIKSVAVGPGRVYNIVGRLCLRRTAKKGGSGRNT